MNSMAGSMTRALFRRPASIRIGFCARRGSCTVTERPSTVTRAVVSRTLPQKLTLTDSAIRVVDPAEVRLDLVFTSADGR